MDQKEARNRLLHLFERVGEPIYFSPRGRNDSRIMYEVDPTTIRCQEILRASKEVQESFKSNMQPGQNAQLQMKMVKIPMPKKMPTEELKMVGQLCPKSTFYSHFNPDHQRATSELMKVFRDAAKTDLGELINMCSYCRDQAQVNCNLWINAFASVLLTNQSTRDMRIVPAAWEIMPDQFFSSSVMAIAARQADLPEVDRALIVTDLQTTATGSNQNPENKLAYWREDPALNSHHWHWHLVYRVEDPLPKPKGRRKGELFYYMHHDILARYNAERLGHGLQPVMPLSIDDNPTLKEGYFAGLFQTNSFQNWGTRQSDTPLTTILRTNDTRNVPPSLGAEMTMERVRTYRDRIQQVIDTGMYRKTEGGEHKVDIDILGDIMEASAYNPDPKFYGGAGFHNVVHSMISFAHDPKFKHSQAPGPMFETTTAMRDPIFYRWHANIDNLFDKYKMTLQPYADKGGEFPLAWGDVEVKEIQMQSTEFGSKANLLSTFWMESHADLSRGLDFFRTNLNKLGAIFHKFKHLNHSPFNYNIRVTNKSKTPVQATVRIYMAPRFNNHEERFSMPHQRKMFMEMDKFVETLRPGDNKITRSSSLASVAIPWEQTFRDLERGSELPSAEQSVCGCGWPQHLLLPRGTALGQIFDLVVFLTNAKEDQVPGTEPPANPKCRESLSFCGRLNQPYPDSKPMGYPWDREPFTVPNPNNPSGPQEPVRNLDEYVSRLPNMKYIQVRIQHHPDRKVVIREDGGPKDKREIMANPALTPVQMCPTSNSAPNTAPGNKPTLMTSTPKPGTGASANSTSGWGSIPQSPGGRAPQWGGQGSGTPAGAWASAGSSSGSWGGGRNPWYSGAPQHQHRPQYGRQGREESPDSPPPQGWARVSNSRPGSPQWSWDG